MYFGIQRTVRYGGALAVRRSAAWSFCNDFTRFLATCVLCSFYNGRRKYDGFRMKLSIFSLSNIVSFANASLCGQKNSGPWFPKFSFDKISSSSCSTKAANRRKLSIAPENCNLNNFVWVFLLILSGVFRLSIKYGLSRFLLSLCCHANNDIIHANCRFFNRFCKRNNLRIIK